MMRAWIGLALLSGSWLFGLGYYHPPNWPAWTVAVVLGTVLLGSRPARRPGRGEMAVGLAMFLPAAWLLPWPYRAAPLLAAAGAALQMTPDRSRWARALGWGGVKAGLVLVAQSLTLVAYSAQTARRHELPWPLPRLLGWAASLLGIDAAVAGQTVATHSKREFFDDAAIHRLAVTWDLLLDPGTVCFFVGGIVLLAMIAWNRLPEKARWQGWIRAIRVFALVTAVWVPVRAALLLALYLHRVLRANPAVALTAMNQFFSPWVALACLLGLALLVWWFVRRPGGEPCDAVCHGSAQAKRCDPGDSSTASAKQWHTGAKKEWHTGYPYPAALVLAACAIAVWSFAVEWDPVGRPKGGRVMVCERHSTWEPTDRPYDKDHFGHDPSYSYTRVYDYCGQYFEMSRLAESDSINRDKLSECDVLVVKIPTARFLPEEVRAITQFVEEGGGLLLVGDHTNVFKSSTYLNDLARPFGFVFRHDLLFAIGAPYEQKLDRPAVPHPIVQHLPPMHYAVSCSIDPGRSLGRAPVRSTGLWSLLPDYYAENYHPAAEYRPDMNFGAFVQLWAVRHGSGRVAAFTDSTIFSNFCTFQPGKAELMVGMLDWLNRRSLLDPAPMRTAVLAVLLLAGLAAAAGAGALAWRSKVSWLAVIGAGVLGWTAASATVGFMHRRAMPPLEAARPMTRVVIDRTVSDVPLSLGAFTQGGGAGYGLFEQWIPRLGYYTKRCSGREAFSGQALVILCPTRSVSREFRQRLVEYVAGGGNVLILDSPDLSGSTVNSLLWPFGMTSDHAASREGKLALANGWPGLEVTACCQINGGEPFLWVGDAPVAARARHGKGSVIAVGVAPAFNDQSMGQEWTTEPDAQLLSRYDLLFALLEATIEGRPVAPPPPRGDGSRQ